MEGDDKKKEHRVPKVGRKAEKKQRKTKPDDSGVTDPRIRNPKAFAINNTKRAERQFRRKKDLDTKKERVPLVDRTPVEPPPFIIAVVGPPKVGKSTLMQNLIKNWTRQTLSEIKGPITIITGKKRRLTLIECNNDINSMIDIAKVADLVLLIIDASFGFEMEVFEFLNICQVHGFPQIMGVLTHLDLLRNKNQLKKVKKTLKHRFWTEVYPGSKLFYLSGYHQFTNSYPKNEIHNLARFISVMKFRPTAWRSEHAFIVADRMEDLTSNEDIRVNPKVDRTVSLYGFVHGTHLKSQVTVHIPGLGDFTPDNVNGLEDPCPLPQKERVLRRSLNEKEKLIYAPFSGVGGIVYDHDAVYIDLGGSHSHGKASENDGKEESESAPLVKELREMKSTLDEKLESAGLQLFSNSDMITAGDVVESDIDDSDEEDVNLNFDHDDDDSEQSGDEQDEQEEEGDGNGQVRRRKSKSGGASFGGDGDGEDFEESMDANFANEKQARLQEASDLFYSRFRHRPLQKMIYDDMDDFMNLESRANFDVANCAGAVQDADEDDNDDYQSLFVGGDFAESAKAMLDQDDEETLGDFEELDNEGDEDDDEMDEKEAELPEEFDQKHDKREAMKKKLKEKFDMEYDDGDKSKDFYGDWKSEVEEQAKLNRTFFESVEDPNLLQELQGLPPGSYVRVQISQVPYEFVTNFDPQRTAPLIIGSLDTPNQETLGVIQARIKKHRWYPKILKTRDPIILSVGWRRFQTIALYSVHDHNMRNRMIKYTSEHLHCVANFFGPVTPQGTGIIGIAPQGTEGFRITLTGTILDMNKSTELVKKLKLIGHPVKIFKKSAFIDGMFNSQLEVTKFVGAKIKCVSGVRGVIKKPLRAPPGSFRAAFEDKVQASDIIFCRTWAKVEIPKFFMSLPTHIVAQPRLVKTLGQLKRERQIQITPNPDNLYTPVERQEKSFRPLKVPKKLQERLPYKEKPKVQAKLLEPKRIAVIREPHERKMSQALKVMRSNLAEKEAREQQEKAKKHAERSKTMKKLEERQNQRQKVLRKKVFRTLGLINKKKENAGGGRSGHRR